MWVIYALFSAVFAALVTVFAKIGLKEIDPTLATTIRGVIMGGFLLIAATLFGKLSGFSASSFSGREWLFITGSGIAGALSWLFYFVALKAGNAGAVASIDRLSIVFIVLLGALFLGEALTLKTGIGALLVALGAILIAF